MHDTGNTRCVVGASGFKLLCAQRLLSAVCCFVHQFIDRIGLIAVCYDRLVASTRTGAYMIRLGSVSFDGSNA